MEKKLYFLTKTNSALRTYSIENIICDLINDKYPGCVVKQKHNEVFLHGESKSVTDEAARFISRNIDHRETLLCGGLRGRKEDVVNHFKNKYEKTLIIYVDNVCQLNLLGRREAVGEALNEFIDISEGRQSMSPANMLSARKPTVTDYPIQLGPVYFRFFKKSHQLEKIATVEKVKITFNESNCTISVQGETENVLRADEYINKTAVLINTREFDIPCFEPVNNFRLLQDNSDADECLKKFDVVLEKKATYTTGNVCVTNQLHGDTSSVWSTKHGTQLSVECLSLDKIQADKKFVMKKTDPSKGIH